MMVANLHHLIIFLKYFTHVLTDITFLFPIGFNSVGIFRKSGGKARIHNLKEMMEGNQG